MLCIGYTSGYTMRTIKRTRTKKRRHKSKSSKKRKLAKINKTLFFYYFLGMKENQCLKRFRLLRDIFVWYVRCIRLRFVSQFIFQYFVKYLFFFDRTKKLFLLCRFIHHPIFERKSFDFHIYCQNWIFYSHTIAHIPRSLICLIIRNIHINTLDPIRIYIHKVNVNPISYQNNPNGSFTEMFTSFRNIFLT